MKQQPDFGHLLKEKFIPSTDEDWDFLRAASQNLFKPKTPVDDDKLFAGRLRQISDILDAVYEEGGHAVIFGERGVGKTSLAKIVEKKIAPIISSLKVTNVSCGKADTFYAIWGNAFNDYSVGQDDVTTHFRKKKNAYAIYNALNDLDRSVYHLFIFDEFDRIQDKETLFLMADLIKHYSNNPINITIIVVGVGDTLVDLFGSHESIARCCSQIKMPRMSENELKEILRDRIPALGFSIANYVESNIVKLSQGLPGYVHLLGQLSLKSAISRRSLKIEREDFQAALSDALDKADYLTRQDYHKATSSPRKDNKYKEVMLACALAKSNELGYFYAGSVREPYSLIRKKPMDITNYSTNLNNLCLAERGPALVKSGKKKSYQYRFSNPLLQPLTIMIGVHEGLFNLD